MYFFPVHQNYVGTDGDKTPFFLSVVLTDANNQCVPQYRAILWKKTVGTVLHVSLLCVSVAARLWYDCTRVNVSSSKSIDEFSWNLVYNFWGRAIAQRLDAGFPPRQPGFAYGQHVGFVVDKAALGQVFSGYFGFPFQSFHRFLHYHNHPGLTQ
jgi:hypothetical protein